MREPTRARCSRRHERRPRRIEQSHRDRPTHRGADRRAEREVAEPLSRRPRRSVDSRGSTHGGQARLRSGCSNPPSGRNCRRSSTSDRRAQRWPTGKKSAVTLASRARAPVASRVTLLSRPQAPKWLQVRRAERSRPPLASSRISTSSIPTMPESVGANATIGPQRCRSA